MKVKIKYLGCKKGECVGFNRESTCYKCLEHIRKWNRRYINEGIWEGNLFIFC
jgi:hypothetical protein